MRIELPISHRVPGTRTMSSTFFTPQTNDSPPTGRQEDAPAACACPRPPGVASRRIATDTAQASARTWLFIGIALLEVMKVPSLPDQVVIATSAAPGSVSPGRANRMSEITVDRLIYHPRS